MCVSFVLIYARTLKCLHVFPNWGEGDKSILWLSLAQQKLAENHSLPMCTYVRTGNENLKT
jgi:hypothetical protein